MAQVIKFRRQKRHAPKRALYRKPRIPRNVFLPIVLGIGVLLNFVDWSSVSRPSTEEAQAPRVLRGGDALNAGRQGLGGRSLSVSQPSSTSSNAGTLVDRVTRVRDGDTIVVGLIPIRIANLDCAESGTAAGNNATRVAKQLVSGETLTCRLEGRRSYDREVGLCSLPDGRDFGEVLVASGVCERW